MRRRQVVGLWLGFHLGIITGLVMWLSRLWHTGLSPAESLMVAIWTLPLSLFVAWFIGRDLVLLMKQRPFLQPALTPLLWLMLLLLVWAVVPA